MEITSNSKPLKEVIIAPSKKVALLIGNEINGISEELLPISDQIVRINMFDNNSSLNMTQAINI